MIYPSGRAVWHASAVRSFSGIASSQPPVT